jgi:hypothetical protein
MPKKAVRHFTIHNQITEYYCLSKSSDSMVLEDRNLISLAHTLLLKQVILLFISVQSCQIGFFFSSLGPTVCPLGGLEDIPGQGQSRRCCDLWPQLTREWSPDMSSIQNQEPRCGVSSL